MPVAEPAPPTRCDALQTKLVSPLTFGALRESGRRGVAVSEAEVEPAMAFAARHLRIVAEPGGAVALAALLAGKAGAVTRADAWSSSRAGMSIRRSTPRSWRLRRRRRSDSRRDRSWAGETTSTWRVSSSSWSPSVRSSAAIDLAVMAGPGQSRRVEQGVEHHRQARQDRLLDPLESLVQLPFRFPVGHGGEAMPARFNLS